MPEIKDKGNFSVRVIDALFKLTPRDGDPNAFTVPLKIETADGYHGWYDLQFSHTVIKSGKNQGLTVADVSNNLLIELGVESGYLGDLIKKVADKSIEAEANFQWEEYEAKGGEMKRVLKCKYLNPPRKTQKLSEVDIADILAKFNGVAPKAEPIDPPASEESNSDNIPF